MPWATSPVRTRCRTAPKVKASCSSMYRATPVESSISEREMGACSLLRADRPDSVGVGLDVSEPMLDAARGRFADQRGIELVRHDLTEPLT